MRATWFIGLMQVAQLVLQPRIPNFVFNHSICVYKHCTLFTTLNPCCFTGTTHISRGLACSHPLLRKKEQLKVYRIKSNFWLVCIPQKVPDVLLLLYFFQGTIQQSSRTNNPFLHSGSLQYLSTKKRSQMFSGFTNKKGRRWVKGRAPPPELGGFLVQKAQTAFRIWPGDTVLSTTLLHQQSRCPAVPWLATTLTGLLTFSPNIHLRTTAGGIEIAHFLLTQLKGRQNQKLSGACFQHLNPVFLLQLI